jgi:hypothetical protein
MSAGQLTFDYRSIITARVRPASKLLWLFVLSRGGEVKDQKRQDIAAALDMHESTVTECAEELESAGWMSGTNRGQGHPKCYRCRQPGREADDLFSRSRETRFQEDGKAGSSTPQSQKTENFPSQQTEKSTAGDLSETALLVAEKSAKTAVAPPARSTYGVAEGGLHLARV